MNIFYLHDNPQISAMAMTNKHVVKMIVESAQLLSTAHHVLDGPDAISGIYKKTHVNHPSAIWTRETTGNYLWLQHHLFWLLNEYATRYNKKREDHATHNVWVQLKSTPKHINKSFDKTPMRIAITDTKHHVKNDAVASYRKYYTAEKLRLDADIQRYKEVLDKYK
jgi:hypothetical protein